MRDENHYINRSNWLRAAVLGANDGILSTGGIAVGVAAASTTSEPVILATVASLVAGALSMAAGEYVSVSSQEDIEKADIERERQELETMPEYELKELTKIYTQRGLSPELARQVAVELTEHDALGTHTRDELGIVDENSANPLEAAMASALAFIAGGMLPLLVALFTPISYLMYAEYIFAIIFLILLGYVSAKLGGAPLKKAIIRVTIWGTIVMVVTAIVGHFFGVNTA